MANTDYPFGFIPIGHLKGSAIPEPHTYVLKTGAKVYKGDPVVAYNTGTINVGAAGATTSHVGIAAEYVYDSASAGGLSIHVYDDPDILYRVQIKTGTTYSQADVFSVADIDTYAVGYATSLQSKCVLAALLASQSPTLPWIVLGLWPNPNNAWGDASVVIVKYNTAVFLPGAYAGL